VSKALNTSLIKAPLTAVAMGLCVLNPLIVLHISALRVRDSEEVSPHHGCSSPLSPASHLDSSFCKVSLTGPCDLPSLYNIPSMQIWYFSLWVLHSIEFESIQLQYIFSHTLTLRCKWDVSFAGLVAHAGFTV